MEICVLRFLPVLELFDKNETIRILPTLQRFVQYVQNSEGNMVKITKTGLHIRALAYTIINLHKKIK